MGQEMYVRALMSLFLIKKKKKMNFHKEDNDYIYWGSFTMGEIIKKENK